MQFDQTTAIVTGAASGLGEATAVMLANFGAKVALWTSTTNWHKL